MKKLTQFILFGLLFGLLALLSACSGHNLKKDESVIFFPTSAHLAADGNWVLPIHHWVFEKEEGSISRKLVKKVISETFEGIGVSEKQADSPQTKKRLMWFLVDNHRNKQIDIILDGQLKTLNKTAANGHAKTLLSLSGKKYKKGGGWVSFKAKDKYQRGFTGEAQLIPQTGLSVISDIDDTIKISEVLDKKALVQNIFTRPYLATPGFPAYYRQLQQQGAYFHYVSASPWQLYPSLKPFMQANYPKGTFSLRNFRLKDSSLLSFFGSSHDYKVKAISEIIKRYPKHQFILIGDSGEHDPEVYTDIYQQFPKQIKSIQIRVVKGSNMKIERFNQLFKVAPKTLWKIFSVPNQ